MYFTKVRFILNGYEICSRLRLYYYYSSLTLLLFSKFLQDYDVWPPQTEYSRNEFKLPPLYRLLIAE